MSSKGENDHNEPLNRDQVVFEYFSKRFDELFHEKCKAESKVINYMTEVCFFIFPPTLDQSPFTFITVWLIEKQFGSFAWRHWRKELCAERISVDVHSSWRRLRYNACQLWRADLRPDWSGSSLEWPVSFEINELFVLKPVSFNSDFVQQPYVYAFYWTRGEMIYMNVN